MIQSKCKPERRYCGSAVNVSGRWRVHLCHLRKNKHHSTKLQRHYNKYGESDLRFSILLGCEKEDLIKNEQYFLDSYKYYFNETPNAGSRLGSELSNETREKISNSMIGIFKGKNHPMFGKHHTSESISKISQSKLGKHVSIRTEFSKDQIPWNKGLKMTEGFREKNRKAQIGLHVGEKNPMFGKHHSKETKEKMTASHLGKSPWNKGRKWHKGIKNITEQIQVS